MHTLIFNNKFCFYFKINLNYKLPKRPMYRINENEIDVGDDEDNLRYIGTFVNDQSKSIMEMPYLTSNLKHFPSLLATPPQSPPDIDYHPQQQPQFHSTTVFGNNNIAHDPAQALVGQDPQHKNYDMPTVRAILSENNVENSTMNFNAEVPCYICKIPFNDVENLRQHLMAHAAHLMSLNSPTTSVSASTSAPPLSHLLVPPQSIPTISPPYHTLLPPPSYPLLPPPNFTLLPPPNYPLVPPPNYPLTPPEVSPSILPPDYTLSPPLSSPDLQPVETGIEIPREFRCETCHKQLNSKISLILHEKTHHKDSSPSVEPLTSLRNKRIRKPYKCSICKKGYKRERNLNKHILILHGVGASQLSQEQPAKSIPDDDGERRIVWSTNLLNAVAAADYCPATERSDKYLAPTVRGSNSFLNHPPKQKYALRSPYCNPYVIQYKSL